MKKIILILSIIMLTFPFESISSINFQNNIPTFKESSFDWNENFQLRRSRGFGGSRRSFGGSRRSSTPKSRPSRSARTAPRTSPKAPSFGGSRISSQQAKQRYGVPTKTSTVNSKSATGQNTQYVMHHYGGYSTGLMTGYMMGTTSWMWMMPFHPAFYYSRPNYVENPDGTVSVYPPTFSFGKMLMTILIIGVIIYFVRNFFRRNSNSNNSTNQGSFG